MKCPICKKELEIKRKKVGENADGTPILNDYAVCFDCKKLWNLDKRREKLKAASVSAKTVTSAKETGILNSDLQANEEPKKPVRRIPKANTSVAPEKATNPNRGTAPRRKAASKAMEDPVAEFSEALEESYADRAPVVKRRRPVQPDPENQTYSNIPPKHIRDTREQEMRTNYQNMLDEGIDDEDDERNIPVVLIVILIILVFAAIIFGGYWFFIR